MLTELDALFQSSSPETRVPDYRRLVVGDNVLAKPTRTTREHTAARTPRTPWYHLGPEYGGKKGDRINDHHLSLEEKRRARREAGKPSEP
jgi:hypothetical protein